MGDQKQAVSGVAVDQCDSVGSRSPRSSSEKSQYSLFYALCDGGHEIWYKRLASREAFRTVSKAQLCVRSGDQRANGKLLRFLSSKSACWGAGRGGVQAA